MGALVIPHDIAAPSLEVVPAALADSILSTLTHVQDFAITDAVSYDLANQMAVRLHELDKQLDANGERIKKPLNQLLKAVRECLDRAAIPLATAKREMQGKIAAYQREQSRIAEEARQKTEAAARIEREKAEAERKRLQAIADAEHAAKVAEAKAKAEQEAKDLEALLGTPVQPEAVTIAAPVVALPEMPVAARTVMPELVKSSVVTRLVSKLDIFDESLVPVSMGGIALRPVDNAAVKRALIAGLIVPGCRMIEVSETSMARVQR